MSAAPTQSHRSGLITSNGMGLKQSPSNSPKPRALTRSRTFYETNLSLKRIIGTTVTSPNALDSLPSSNIFAYTAGAAAVIAEKCDNGEYTQRFYRARPTAVAVSSTTNTASSLYGLGSAANDSKSRLSASARETRAGSPASTFGGGDEPSSKTWTSRERIKAATCLSLSQDGKYMAVGETGYNPRVLIFGIQDTSSDRPLAILHEHTFGVSAVAFSADSKYLASLGTINDGFIYVWAINSKTGTAKLHSSNKCTNFVRSMAWMGNNLVTVGLRHVRIWRIEDGPNLVPSKQKFALDGTPIPVPAQPTLKTLNGRNCLLGPLLIDATFTCVVVLSDCKAIVCTEKGDVCLINDSDAQSLNKVAHAAFAVSCAALDHENGLLRLGGHNGKMIALNLEDLTIPWTPPRSPVKGDFPDSSDSAEEPTGSRHLCAMVMLAQDAVTVDASQTIAITASNSDGEVSSNPFAAHSDPVLGVGVLPTPNAFNADFFTWSSCGTLLFWNTEGSHTNRLQVELEQLATVEEEWINQCQIIACSDDASFLVAGDKYGVMRVIDSVTGKCTFRTKAHSETIQDIAISQSERATLIATCGRDRVVQLFRKDADSWTHVQTLDDHAASVCSVLFCDKGQNLVSCAADRTIHIRDIVILENDPTTMAALSVRTIVLKASPNSMTLFPNMTTSILVVSALDRTVATYDLASGRLLNTFRASDNDNTEAVVMGALTVGKVANSQNGHTVLAGISGTDKSVRIYDAATGAFLDREWGHTASVTDVALIDQGESTTLISTATDGTIMIWDLTSQNPDSHDSYEPVGDTDSGPPKEIISARLPLRRVLSKSELAELQRSSGSSTSTINRSPPRSIRKKTSKASLKAPIPPRISLPPTYHVSSASDDLGQSHRVAMRAKSRSPPISPRNRDQRTRTRTQSSQSGQSICFGESSINIATEQMSRSLRAFRRKLTSTTDVREDLLRELAEELDMTGRALATRNGDRGGEGIEGMVEDYSERLMVAFKEKLKGLGDSAEVLGDEGVMESIESEGSYSPTVRVGSPEEYT